MLLRTELLVWQHCDKMLSMLLRLNHLHLPEMLLKLLRPGLRVRQMLNVLRHDLFRLLQPGLRRRVPLRLHVGQPTMCCGRSRRPLCVGLPHGRDPGRGGSRRRHLRLPMWRRHLLLHALGWWLLHDAGLSPRHRRLALGCIVHVVVVLL